MGRTLLMLVLATSLLSGSYLYTARRNVVDADRRLARTEERVLARTIAHTAYARALRSAVTAIRSTSSLVSRELSGTYEGGSYRVSIREEAGVGTVLSTVLIDARGTFAGADHRIEARLREALPPSHQYAMFADGDLAIQGNASTVSLDTTQNANVHTNGALTLDGTGSREKVTGFATYVDAFSGDESTVEPNWNPEEEDPVRQGDPISAEQLDVSEYQSQADTVLGPTVWSGALTTLSLSLDPSDPEIWYVDGDLKLSGDVKVGGYGIILVSGDVRSTGGGSLSYLSGVPTDLTIGVGGSLTLSGTTDLEANLFTNGGATVKGSPTLTGSVITAGELNADQQSTGTPTVRYRPPNAQLEKFLWADQMTLDLLEKTEW